VEEEIDENKILEAKFINSRNKEEIMEK